jgi:dihydroxy-acid dehydratase
MPEFGKQQLHNALAILLAVGGSTNALVHLAAIVGRVGLQLDPAEFNRLANQIPVLVDLKPGGEGYMPDFHEAGGLIRVLAQLTDLVELDFATVFGDSLRTRLDAFEASGPSEVIRDRTNPIYPNGGLRWLSGNLAPRGAVIKPVAASEKLLEHTGRAVVFDGLEDMARRLDDPDLDVQADDILVLRGIGPKGAGMPEAGLIPIPKKLAAKGVRDMVRISDGRMSGTAYGTIVLHISPEAADGGPLSLVRSGDQIRLSVKESSLSLLVDEATLESRQAEGLHRTLPTVGQDRGYGRLHSQEVLQAEDGCDFRFLRSTPD